MANSYNVGSVDIAVTADARPFIRDLERARQEGQRSGTAVGNAFRQNTQGIRTMGSQVQQVRAQLRSMANEATRTLRQLRTGLMAGTAAAGAMAAGFVVMFRRATAAAESIADMALQTNTATEALQELRFAADQNGSSAQAMDTALQRLNSSIGDTIRGQGSARNAFRALGLEADIVSGRLRGTDEVFMAVVRAMERIPDAATRASLASEILGRQGRELAQLMSLGADGIAQARDRARELGIVLRDDAVQAGAAANVEMRELGMSIRNNMTQAILEAAPAIRDVMARVAEFIPVLTQWALAVTDLFERIGGQGWSNSNPEEAARRLRIQASRAQAGEIHRYGSSLVGEFALDIERALGTEGLRQVQADIIEIVNGIRDSRGRNIRGDHPERHLVDDAVAEYLRGVADRILMDARSSGRLGGSTPTLPALPGVTPPGTTGGDPVNDLNREQAAAEDTISTYERWQTLKGQWADQDAETARAREEAHDRLRKMTESEFRHELDLARLRGDSGEIERLEREEAIRSRVAELMDLQVGYAEALNRATNEANEREDAGAIGEMRAQIEASREDWRRTFQWAFSDAMRAAAEGDLGGVFEGLANQFSYQVFDMLGGQLFDMLFGGMFDQAQAAAAGAVQGQAAGVAIGASMTTAGATSAAAISKAMTAAGIAAAGAIAQAMAVGGGISSIIPGFNTGGSMMIRGRPGVDRNMLSLNGKPIARVSDGEMLNIVAANQVSSPVRALASPGSAPPARALIVQVDKSEYFDVAVQEAAGPMVAQAGMAASANAQAQIARRLDKQKYNMG